MKVNNTLNRPILGVTGHWRGKRNQIDAVDHLIFKKRHWLLGYNRLPALYITWEENRFNNCGETGKITVK